MHLEMGNHYFLAAGFLILAGAFSALAAALGAALGLAAGFSAGTSPSGATGLGAADFLGEAAFLAAA
jgi:hypothetical protein